MGAACVLRARFTGPSLTAAFTAAILTAAILAAALRITTTLCGSSFAVTGTIALSTATAAPSGLARIHISVDDRADGFVPGRNVFVASGIFAGVISKIDKVISVIVDWSRFAGWALFLGVAGFAEFGLFAPRFSASAGFVSIAASLTSLSAAPASAIAAVVASATTTIATTSIATTSIATTSWTTSRLRAALRRLFKRLIGLIVCCELGS
jgi:hypothetical protein